MTYIEEIEALSGKELLVGLFEFVQKIPYRVCPFEEAGICGEAVHVGLKKGDCRHKTLLLYNLLLEKNFDVERVKVVFDWKDLAIPSEILGILEKSGTRAVHECLKIPVNSRYSVYVDPTWNLELERLGFPVTRGWNGEGPTCQVTNGELGYFDFDGFDAKEHGVDLDEGEVREFGEVLNMWLDEVCPIG